MGKIDVLKTAPRRNLIAAGSGRKCRCGDPAVIVYAGMDMCERDANTRARYDESPARR